ncbi:MAG: RNA-binding S4 domain-containing protein [Candidatus Omnitrophica bacterium]|nr:RNA-binding S4 domain-containing protein [Candidatus Omnitrophota bacterium]
MDTDAGRIRLDKWLWAVRICKTRAAATDLCKRQRVSVDGQNAKPSREIREGNLITVKRDGIDWQYKVLKCIDKRVGAKIAAECREDLTPKEDLKRLKEVKSSWTPRRPKGEGRPTKKDRRDLDKLHGR